MIDEKWALFYDDIKHILVHLTDERIAEIYCEVNSHSTPIEFKYIKEFRYKEDLSKEDLRMIWSIFSATVKEIIPENTINKIHARNLDKKGFRYGKTFLHFNEDILNP